MRELHPNAYPGGSQTLHEGAEGVQRAGKSCVAAPVAKDASPFFPHLDLALSWSPQPQGNVNETIPRFLLGYTLSPLHGPSCRAREAEFSPSAACRCGGAASISHPYVRQGNTKVTALPKKVNGRPCHDLGKAACAGRRDRLSPQHATLPRARGANPGFWQSSCLGVAKGRDPVCNVSDVSEGMPSPLIFLLNANGFDGSRRRDRVRVAPGAPFFPPETGSYLMSDVWIVRPQLDDGMCLFDTRPVWRTLEVSATGAVTLLFPTPSVPRSRV